MDSSESVISSDAKPLLRNAGVASMPPQNESAYAVVSVIAVGAIVVFFAVMYFVRREHSLTRRDSDWILPPVRSKRFTRD
eukprot:319167-Ditylum_brightwellii.AAC.1